MAACDHQVAVDMVYLGGTEQEKHNSQQAAVDDTEKDGVWPSETHAVANKTDGYCSCEPNTALNNVKGPNPTACHQLLLGGASPALCPPINGCAADSCHMQSLHQHHQPASRLIDCLPGLSKAGFGSGEPGSCLLMPEQQLSPPVPLDMKLQLKVLPSQFDHTNNHGKSTFFQATLNCVSLLYGLGILSSPYAVARAGWMGVAISIMVSSTYAYTAYLMARCVEFDPTCSNYQDIAKLALGTRMRKVITALFYMELTGTLVGYCISMGDNLNYIFPHVGFNLPGLSNRNLMICLVTLIILPSVWLRDLSALSFTSIWCIASSVLLLVGVMLAATMNHIRFTHPLSFIHIKGVPVAAGLYAFSYGGTSVFPSIYKSMKDPSKFTQVLILSFFIATTSITGLGIAGAYMFGEQTASQVTLSMPVHYITTKIVLWMTILTPIFKFALQLSPITTAVEAQIYKRRNKAQEGGRNNALRFAISTLMRSFVLALIAIVSMILPYFEYIIALVGSSMTIGICMIFPCLFYLKLYWKRLSSLTIIFVTILISLGLVVGACGTITAFQGLVHSKTTHHSD